MFLQIIVKLNGSEMFLQKAPLLKMLPLLYKNGPEGLAVSQQTGLYKTLKNIIRANKNHLLRVVFFYYCRLCYTHIVQKLLWKTKLFMDKICLDMGKYVHLFETTNEFNSAYTGEDYVEPWVSYTRESSAVTYNKDPFNGHAYVDLGLPSGKLWATCNVGANSPEDFGNRYAWGETATKSTYSWGTYAFGSDTSNLTKYNSTDGKTVLDLEDDAAHVVMGGDWHMPTKADYQELTANTSSVWDGAKSGRTFTSNINGKSIFIPAFSEASYEYFIWTSSLMSTVYNAQPFHLIAAALPPGNNRCFGYNVRGVIG